jgi:hypothetical protein
VEKTTGNESTNQRRYVWLANKVLGYIPNQPTPLSLIGSESSEVKLLYFILVGSCS